MIKKIAQVINEANLVLNEGDPDSNQDGIITPQEFWDYGDPDNPWGGDVFQGQNQHKFSSPDWLQPYTDNTGPIDNIKDVIFVSPWGKEVAWVLRTLRKDRWPDGTDPDVIITENLKSIIRFLLRPHGSSGGGNPDDDWIAQIDNSSWFGIKNILFQILLPILKDTGYDITPVLDHPDISNSPWEWLTFPGWPWMH
ncbi:MAG: hypothetical protein H8D80_00220 [Proteobacteria bacterium]|nr:hypothetical protein [Pseudomonadota bacterium]